MSAERIFAMAIGVGTSNSKGELLEAFYPQPLFQPKAALANACRDAVDGKEIIDPANIAKLTAAFTAAGHSEQAALAEQLAGSERPLVVCILSDDGAPESVAAAYLKLHLISHRFCKPHTLSLDGLFAVLPNNAWTSAGAIALDELTARQFDARLRGEVINVMSVDKFPKMTDYVVPSGVRIAHTARVRLGAYLGEGTTIMHEGFVNFNAGTEGPGMIEGRISAGVFVGAGSDLGGGCSTMGTLSGGNNTIISIGDECLVGANAGVGIPLGHRCTIEAGLYVTGGSLVTLLDDKGETVKSCKARDLAGVSDLLFRRNSKSGTVECMANRSAIELNEALHAHN